MKKTGCFPVEFKNTGSHLISAVFPTVIRDFHIVAAGKETDRLNIIKVFNLHNKGDNVSPRTAAKAVERLGVRINNKRGRFFRVKRAETFLVPTSPADGAITGHNVLNVSRLAKLHNKAVRNSHSPHLLSGKTNMEHIRN